ncbi:MAG: nucleotidyl transferase AbiEii/AbiGii toxin family protein [Desulfovibrionaceae bacterium]|nr:nucleotidyl transferase AbiEii/AbiGii toxin family protein [Desulfovibrionaceae bacterium]
MDIVEQSILLDAILKGLQEEKLINDLAIKGGGAIQRVYASERFSSDLDFACGRKPKFTKNEFIEFG